MQTNLFNLKAKTKAKYIYCEDNKKGKELVPYGFIYGMQLEVVKVDKHGVVVQILDALYSLNCRLAMMIIVEV